MKKILLALAFTAGLTSFAGSAKAGLTFDWSFVGTVQGTVEGTVSGVLTLNDAGTAATSVYVTGAPLSYDSTFNYADSGKVNFGANGFAVDNGNIIGANFFSFDPGIGEVGLAYKYEQNAYGTDGNWTFDKPGTYVLSDQGVAGINFTPATGGTDTAAVPEPSQVAASLLLVGGIAGFVIVKRRKEASLALAA
jgi:hypothetical protein